MSEGLPQVQRYYREIVERARVLLVRGDERVGATSVVLDAQDPATGIGGLTRSLSEVNLRYLAALVVAAYEVGARPRIQV